MISKETAYDICSAYQEIERAEKLLVEVEQQATKSRDREDIRDHFGRRVDGLQLGIPSGSGGHRLMDLQWSLARPVIEAHIAHQRSVLSALKIKAQAELEARDD